MAQNDTDRPATTGDCKRVIRRICRGARSRKKSV